MQEIDLYYDPLDKKFTKIGALVTKICFFPLCCRSCQNLLKINDIE